MKWSDINDRKKTSSPFAGLNRPTAGARTSKEVPRGQHALQLYSWPTPNGQKAAICLEELGLPYDAWPINIMTGDQFTSGFVEINPNSKIPAMVDYKGPDGKQMRVFESGSILLYLAEKTGRLIPFGFKPEVINWVFFNMGSAPFFGQFGHFYKYCTDKIPYAIDRYTMETQRILDVLDQHLDGRTYLVGEEFSIADIAWFPWIRCLTHEQGYNARAHLGTDKYRHLNAWFNRIAQREAVQRGLKVNSLEQREKH